MSMQQMLESSARYHANRVAIVEGDREIRYAEFHERVLRLANALRSLGLERGDRIAILSLNSSQFSEFYFACCEAGLAGVPLNLRFSPDHLARYLDYTGARALIVDARLASLAEPILARASTIAHTIGYGEGHGQPLDYDALLAAAPPQGLGPSDPDAPVLIAPTSGTTGVVKGAILTQRNTYMAGLGWLAGFPMTPESRHVIALPMFFASGAPGWYLSYFVGASNVMLPRFDCEALVELIERTQATHVVLGPAMLYQLLDLGIDWRRLSSVEVLGAGGAPFDPSRFAELREVIGDRIMIFFGLTEVAATASFLRPSDYVRPDGSLDKRFLSVGKPWPGVRLLVTDDDGHEIPSDGVSVGEIRVAGPTVGGGYWEMPEETAAAFRDGWFLTGDLATVDEDGFVYIVDRKKDIIVSGGINIGSLEVEQVIGQHPAVAAVAVIGVPHPKWGEGVHAVVVPRPGVPVDAAAIINWCRDRLASYKKPQSVEFIDALPVNANGKILKRELRDKYWQGRARKI